MRCTSFFLTFFGFVCVHFMRMSFPFVQYDLMLLYQTDDKYIGLISTISNLLMGLGFFFRVIFPFHKPVQDYFCHSNLVSICLLMIPLSIYAGIKSTALVAIFYCLFGWFQAGLYSLLLVIINRNFRTDEDGCILGFWSTAADVGNILGLLICTLLVYWIKADWKLCLVAASLLNIVLNIIFKICLKEEVIQFQDKSVCQHFDYFRDFFSQAHQILMFMIFASVGATQFGVLLWLPMYLQQAGFRDFQGYITICYSVFSLIGATIAGTMYEKINNRITHFKIHCFLLLSSLIPLLLIYCFQFQEQDKWIMLALIGMSGFCIGSNYDLYGNHEILLLTEEQSQNIQINNSIMCGGMHISVGITQLIIGFFSSLNPSSIFLLFIAFVSISIFLLVIRICLQSRNQPQYVQPSDCQ